MPKPVHDPRRFLRQEKEFVVNAVPQLPVVTLGHWDANDAEGADVSVDEEIPEYAEAQTFLVPEMPNLQPKARAVLNNAVSYEAVPDAMPDVADASEELTVTKNEPDVDKAEDSIDEAPKQEAVVPLQAAGDDAKAEAQHTTGDVGTLSGARQKIPGTPLGVGNPGGAATTSGEISGGTPSPKTIDMNEEQLWQTYAKTLVRYFAKKRSYPPMARKLGQQGTVWVDVEILRSGQITNIELSKSSGFKVLDEAALALVKKADDLPPFPEGITAQKIKIRIPLEYTLRRE